jgi:hypothetical protein
MTRCFSISTASVVVVLFRLCAFSVEVQDSSASKPADNAELALMYQEDQSDRMPADGKPIDWKVVAPRDKVRETRAKELYTANQLKTGADYYYVAMILQHAATPEDYLLAHELCIVAIIKGEERAKWLAAASEDRFLMNIGRPQRFGTQYRTEGPGGPLRLYQMGEGVSDTLRAAFDVPSLNDARKLEEKPKDTLQ